MDIDKINSTSGNSPITTRKKDKAEMTRDTRYKNRKKKESKPSDKPDDGSPHIDEFA